MPSVTVWPDSWRIRVFLGSIEKASLRRWCSPIWEHYRLGGRRPTLSMGQDSLDYRRVFNAGDDLDLPGAPFAGLDVNVEHPF
jgi:hypothetical protein